MCCLLVWFAMIPAHVLAQGKTTILVLGDSLAAGFGVEKEEAFPFLLEQRLKEEGFEDIRVVNGGFSGSTTAGALKRMKWYLKLKPDFLILELGANDGLRGHDIASIRRNLEKTIVYARERKMRVLLAGMKIPINYGKEYTLKFEQIFTSLAEQYSITLIPFLLDGVAGRKDLNLADGIHPNPEGHKIVAENVLAVIRPLLTESK